MMTAETPIFFVIEFQGDGDPSMGGSAADWGLYQVDGAHQFMPAYKASPRRLPHSYFPTKDEAEAAAKAASVRGGLISVLEKTIDPKIPTGQIRHFVMNCHVGTPDDEISGEVIKRLSKGCDGDQEILAQASTFAVACHRANQDLVRQFRL
jgi:hypothetical protein